jgi:hypothetical protein
MPRTVSSAFQAAIASKTVRMLLLFEAFFDSGPVLLWTGYGTITIASRTYTGAGTFISLSEFKETDGVESQGLAIRLSGIPSSAISLALSEPYQGRIVRIQFGMMTETLGIIADPVLLFTGRADTMNITDAGDTCTIELNAENHFVDLLRGRGRKYTHQDQQIDHPGDKFFDKVEGLQDKVFQWGA